MKGSNPGGQSRDNNIIEWIKKRFKESEIDYMEEYPYEVMLSYPTSENKVRTFFLLKHTHCEKNQSNSNMVSRI